MAKDFVRLSEVPVVEEVVDTASVLVEMDGEIYRAPKTQVGGAGGLPVAIIEHSAYLDFLDWVINSSPDVSSFNAESESPYKCTNMTFQEAWDILSNGQPLTVIGLFPEYGVCNPVMFCCVGPSQSSSGSNEIDIIFPGKVRPETLIWTADGIFELSNPQPE